jgi:ribosomal protein L29
MAIQTTTFDPKDLPSKRALKAEKKRERDAELIKQKARANELKQAVKQASQDYRLKKRDNRKHIKDIKTKAINERCAELKKAQFSTNVKLAMEEFHKQQQADNLRRKLLVRQIGIETKIEYVKTLRQIDEAYPELRHKQVSFKVKK